MTALLAAAYLAVSTAPFVYLRYLPFTHRLRFSLRATAAVLAGAVGTIIALFAILSANGVIAPYSPAMAVYRGVAVAALLLLSCVLIRERFVKHYFVYNLVMCFQMLVYGAANFAEQRYGGALAARYPYLVNIAVMLLLLLPLAPLFCRYLLGTLLPFLREDNSKVWNIIWLVPTLSYYSVLLFATDPVEMARPRNVVSRVILMTGCIVLCGVLLETLRQTRRAGYERMRSDFLAGASHDLKTPVAAMGVALQRLGSVEDEAERRRFLETLRKNQQDLSRRVVNLLDAARLEEPGLAFRAVAFPAESLCLRVRDRYEDLLADDSLLWSVLDNLVFNALRHTEPGGSVRVSLTEREGRLLLEVADDGCGIPPERLPRLFDRGYAAGESGGSGLGLYIVETAMEGMGGGAQVRSEPGKGTRVILDFPAAEEQPAP